MKLATLLLPWAAVCCLQASAFEYEGLEYEDLGDGTAQLYSATGATGDITVPATVYDTDGNAYTVVAIRRNCFRSAKLGTVALPATLKTIGHSAFAHSSVEKIAFNEGLETIEGNAFYNCRNLDNVVLPTTLKELGEMAFYSCQSLMKIALPEGLTTLHSATFKECTRLETVELPASLTQFEDQVFSTCYSLESMAVPEGTTVIPESFCYQCSQLYDLQLPATVEVIKNGAFGFCHGLEHVELPNSVTTLLNGAFVHCTGLKEIVVPASVRTMGSDIFYQNSSVQTITLGENVEVLGFGTLGAWEVLEDKTHQWALTDIYCLNPVPARFEYDGYARPEPDFFSLEDFTDEERERFYNTVTLHVPAEALETYTNADLWSAFKTIVGDATGIQPAATGGPRTEAYRGGIRLTGMEPGTLATVYGTAGQTLGNATAGEGGTLQFGGLTAGIYMVRTGNACQKVLVR